MARGWRHIASAALTLTLLTGLSFATWNTQQFNYRPHLYENMYLPSGKFLEHISLGYKELAADIVWLQAVQYYGGYRHSYHGVGYLRGLIELVTDLDPHFSFPYTFGAIVVGQDMGDADGAVAILRKAMANDPTNWQYPFDAGFVLYVLGEDPARAAHYFHLAAKLPGASPMAHRFAAWVYSQSGHAENSIRMWQEVLESNPEPMMREMAERYVDKLKAKVQQQQLQQQDAQTKEAARERS